MNSQSALLLTLLLAAPAWAELAAPDNTYKQPYPHSSGAELLPFCEQTEVVVSQLRCDYYVQGVADLAVIPRKGKPIACIPQGQSRTQLMQIAVAYMKTVHPDTLEKESAASLILKSFKNAFPCPKIEAAAPAQAEEAVPLTPEQLEEVKQYMLESRAKAKANRKRSKEKAAGS
jgi:hypothetical protein